MVLNKLTWKQSKNLLYYIYTLEHQTSLNPVKLNDVGFSIHGFFVAMIFICQCTIYERGQQRVSGFCKFILVGIFMLLAICFILMSV